MKKKVNVNQMLATLFNHDKWVKGIATQNPRIPLADWIKATKKIMAHERLSQPKFFEGDLVLVNYGEVFQVMIYKQPFGLNEDYCILLERNFEDVGVELGEVEVDCGVCLFSEKGNINELQQAINRAINSEATHFTVPTEWEEASKSIVFHKYRQETLDEANRRCTPRIYPTMKVNYKERV